MALAEASNGLYLDGKWITDTEERIESKNPADATEIVGTVAAGGREEAQAALNIADASIEEWKYLTPHERGGFLHDAADHIEGVSDELARLVSREMGKTISAAQGETQRTIDLLNYYAEVARDKGGVAPPSASDNTVTYTTREPWGVVSAITPWNYPIAIPTWKIAPALVAGNTVVFKPASQTPVVASELVRAFDKVGLPDGVFNFVPGSGSTVGKELTTNEIVDVVSFTGSYSVGKLVQAAATQEGKRVQCEMGGKNPLIVDETADIDLSVELTVEGGLAGLAGQACTATSRVLVFESVYDEYLARLQNRVESMSVGNPLCEGTDMGPKSSEGELESDLEYIDAAKEGGAELVVGGNRLTGGEFDGGYFIEPTVFTEVDSDMRIAQEEVFGPVLSVIRVSNFREAIDVANDVDYGLSASICTNRLDRVKNFINDIETGVVKINQTTTGVEMQLPFGGRKNSSTETFKEQGRQALDFYTHQKAIYITHFDN